MKPIDVNETNYKYIKNTIYKYNVANKIPKFKINDIVRISLKRRELFDKPRVISNGLRNYLKFIL